MAADKLRKRTLVYINYLAHICGIQASLDHLRAAIILD